LCLRLLAQPLFRLSLFFPLNDPALALVVFVQFARQDQKGPAADNDGQETEDRTAR